MNWEIGESGFEILHKNLSKAGAPIFKITNRICTKEKK